MHIYPTRSEDIVMILILDSSLEVIIEMILISNLRSEVTIEMILIPSDVGGWL